MFGKSKCEDAVDRWNNIWTVVFFLVLTLVTLLMSSSAMFVKTEQTVPKFRTSCWCPAQFTSSHYAYVITFCGKALDDYIRGKNKTQVLHEIRTFDEQEKDEPLLPPDITNFTKNILKHLVEGEKKPKEEKDDEQTTVFHREYLPLSLFLFAILIKLPYALSNLFSGCCGLLNMNHTIDVVFQAQFLEKDIRQHTVRDVANCAAQNVRHKPQSASLIFMSVKLLCCFVLVFAMFNNYTTTALVHGTDQIEEHDASTKILEAVADKPLLCGFQITQLTNFHSYEVQCIFRTPSPEERNDSLNLNDFYMSLCHCVFAYLVILLVANVLSFSLWVLRLVGRLCHPPSTALSPGTALDLHLLVLLAHDNAGPLVSRDLATALMAPLQGSDPGKMETALLSE